MDIIFLHGRATGPHGSKIQSIRAAGWNLSAPDCKGIEDVHERVAIARRALKDAGDEVVLVGSSFGGLTAALLLSELAGSEESSKVKGLLLLAPALHMEPAKGITAVPPNTLILHGVHDTVVPIEHSRAFATRFACELVEVEDDHRLRDSHPQILSLLERVVGGPVTP
jgi:alpha-beta hydrolase superfamily lysophospholipase